MGRRTLLLVAVAWLAGLSLGFAQQGSGNSPFDRPGGPREYFLQPQQPELAEPPEFQTPTFPSPTFPQHNMGPQPNLGPQMNPGQDAWNGQGVQPQQMVWTKTCTNCDKEVADTSRVGQRCPHCGVLWTSDDTTGDTPGGVSDGAAFAVGAVIVIGVVGCVIYLAMRKPNLPSLPGEAGGSANPFMQRKHDLPWLKE